MKGFARYLIYSVALTLTILCVKGQTFTQTMSYADSLYAAKDYASAYPVYRRLLFFSDSITEIPCIEKLLTCSEHLGKYDEAAHYCRLLQRVAATDSLVIVYVLGEYANSLKNDDIISDLYNPYAYIDAHALNTEQRIRLYFYHGLVCVKVNARDAAIASFMKLTPYLTSTDSINLVKLCNEYRRKTRIDPEKTGKLSLLLPGLGQLSLHDYKNASNSFLLNGALITGLVVTTINYTLLDGVLFWGPAIGHYYIGGKDATRDLAIVKLKKRQDKYYNAFVQTISSFHFLHLKD